MNLYDMARRGDRMLDAPAGSIDACVLKLAAGTQRAVRLAHDARIRLRHAHEATCLLATPADPGWVLHTQGEGQVRVWLEAKDRAPVLLADTAAQAMDANEVAVTMPAPRSWPARLALRLAGTPSVPIAPRPPARRQVPLQLSWPVRMPIAYDLVLESSEDDVAIAVGPLHDVRRGVLAELRGNGLEVGPGANPAVVDSDIRSVRYVEKMSATEWAQVYPKESLDAAVMARWSQYTIASAETLDGIATDSLDFIFSSHVLEHLVNPLQVLQNWWQCLAPGGGIVGVVPDARYSFDLRQPLTTLDELLAQLRAGAHERTDAMYQRWCRHTSPEADIASLRARDYAIHVNYFSPESFGGMLQAFAGLVGTPGGAFVEQFQNGKDFAFAVFKPT